MRHVLTVVGCVAVLTASLWSMTTASVAAADIGALLSRAGAAAILNLKVTLSGASAGEYRVQFVVRDLNWKKTATVTQPVTVR